VKDSARYVKVVEWSNEDDCHVGSAPGLFHGGCQRDGEQQVVSELCRMVAETIALHADVGRPLPPTTSARDIADVLGRVA